MRRLLYTLFILNLSISAKAQITLEHTFNDAVQFWPSLNSPNFVYLYDINSGDAPNFYYTKLTGNTYTYKKYATDYSLISSTHITFEIPANYTLSSVTPLSFGLIDATNEKEYALNLISTTIPYGENGYAKLCIYDQKGKHIYDFGNFSQFVVAPTVMYEIDGVYKFLLTDNVSNSWVYRSSYKDTEEYPGPGPSGLDKAVSAKSKARPYPVPAQSTVSLPYQLKEEEETEMIIYNAEGQIIESKRIDSSFERIQLNVSDYPSGVYIYNVKDISSRFIVQ